MLLPYGKRSIPFFISHYLFLGVLIYTSYRTIIFLTRLEYYLGFYTTSWKDLELLFYHFNLVFHELGHLVFSLSGEFIGVAGGTIAQFIFPVLFLLYFRRQKNTLGVVFCIWWISYNIITVGVYMRDAEVQKLPLLVEGGIHDFWYIFNRLGWLAKSHLIGTTVIGTGILTMTGSLLYYLYYLSSLFINRNKMRKDIMV